MTYRLECSVRIDAPRERVWALLQDFSRRTEWDLRVVRAAVVTPPPQGKGTRFRIKYRVAGISYNVENEYLVWKPNERSAIRFPEFHRDLLFRNVAGSWRLTPHDNGSTTWTTTVSMTMRGGPLAPLLERVIIGWYFRRLTEASQRKLKRLIESEIVAEPLAV
jgi:uncharacterized protein YndB with AHSA1/START domain